MSKLKKKIQIVVVCEDNAHAVLIRNYLDRVGYERRKVRFLTSPSGRGAGERFVKLHYPTELSEYRKRNPEYWRFVVVIDADTGTVREHEAELGKVASESGQAPRQSGEGVVHLIPKRNVETWIHRLLGEDTDEETDYKSQYASRAENDFCRQAAKELTKIVRDQEQQANLPSLRLAVTELREKLNGSHS